MLSDIDIYYKNPQSSDTVVTCNLWVREDSTKEVRFKWDFSDKWRSSCKVL